MKIAGRVRGRYAAMALNSPAPSAELYFDVCSVCAETHRWMLFMCRWPTVKTTTDGWQVSRPADNRHPNL